MKIFPFYFFKVSYWRLERFWSIRHNKAKQLSIKQDERRKRIKEAYKYLHEWEDIPVSQLFGSVCDILKIKKNKAALDLIYRMNMDLREEDLEKIIPL